jgi:beta-glucanase (GH16 family)
MVFTRIRARRRRPALRAAFAGATALAALAMVSGVAPAHASVPPVPGGWSQVFADDFDGSAGSSPSSANWQYDLGHSYPGGAGNWGTGEIQEMTSNPANVSLDGSGNLRITPLRDGAGNWTSARIETRRADFKAPSGGVLRIEARIQMPDVTGAAAEGYWPAFWALGNPFRGNYQNWPSIGELDVMENVNGLNTTWGTLHCGVAPGGPCNEFNGIGNNRPCPGPSCQSGFHTYRFDWDRSVNPNQLRWYVNDELFHTVSQNQLPADTWNQMTSHAGYFLLLNVSIGGAFPNAVAGKGTPTGATVSGRPMVVDYVSVSQSGGGSNPPPPPPPGGSNQLTSGQRLSGGQELVSSNGRFHLKMQTDGNLVIYDGSSAIWATGTWNLPADRKPTRADMQADGNLVLYNDANQAAWASGSWGSGRINPFLEMQDDGNLVIYHNGTNSLWASGTAR